MFDSHVVVLECSLYFVYVLAENKTKNDYIILWYSDVQCADLHVLGTRSLTGNRGLHIVVVVAGSSGP